MPWWIIAAIVGGVVLLKKKKGSAGGAIGGGGLPHFIYDGAGWTAVYPGGSVAPVTLAQTPPYLISPGSTSFKPYSAWDSKGYYSSTP